MDLALVLVETGKSKKIPSLETALSYKYSDAEIQIVKRNRKRMLIGTPDNIKEQILKMSEIYKTDEFMLITLNRDLNSKINSYKLIARCLENNKKSNIVEFISLILLFFIIYNFMIIYK
ncbi:hypothetical protein [Clostridium sartagoforme]|uniref:hypothetical protein n=1 Tax=Clostridium sartagoforme TaxID=84031 RepID=UPI0031D10B7D